MNNILETFLRMYVSYFCCLYVYDLYPNKGFGQLIKLLRRSRLNVTKHEFHQGVYCLLSKINLQKLKNIIILKSTSDLFKCTMDTPTLIFHLYGKIHQNPLDYSYLRRHQIILDWKFCQAHRSCSCMETNRRYDAI